MAALGVMALMGSVSRAANASGMVNQAKNTWQTQMAANEANDVQTEMSITNKLTKTVKDGCNEALRNSGS